MIEMTPICYREHVLQDDRIITQEDPQYYGQKHTSVALPAIVIPREYLSYVNTKPNDDYTNVRSSSRKTNPYLPTRTRFEEADPLRELLLQRQNGDSVVQYFAGPRVEYQTPRPRKGKCDEEVPHIVGYFNVSHRGIVPKDRHNGKDKK